VQITRNSRETAAGPSDWFTGAIYIDTAATRSGASRLGASVHLTPGARTAWHAPERGRRSGSPQGVGLC
jgi:quercetin dioxygenase-like cupin family protein